MSSNTSNSNIASADNWCTTESRVEAVEYNWNINNFDFHEAKGTALISPEFYANTTYDKFKWYLLCEPNGKSVAKNSVSLYLYLKSCAVEKLFVKFVFSALDKDGNVFGNFTSLCCEFSPSKLGFVRHEFFKKDEKFYNLLKTNDNKLTFRCAVRFSAMRDADITCHSSLPKTSLCHLSENLASLFENQEFSDVTFSVNSKNYRAHKAILTARSPVFAAMFRHNMTETEQNRVVIDDLNGDVVVEMLRYIYTGKCQNLKEFAEELLVAADKYALDGLQIMCMQELCKTLSVENSIRILKLADLYDLKNQKNEIIKLIAAKFYEIVNTSSWKDLMSENVDLANEICQALAHR